MFVSTASLWPLLAAATLKSTLILLAAWIVACLLRGCSAASRHIVWTACAAALLALPLLTATLPALRVRAANALLPADTGLMFRSASAITAASPSAAPATSAAARAAGPTAAAFSLDARPALALVWGLGILAGLLQIFAATGMLARLRRAASASPLQEAADSLARQLGILHPIRVLEAPTAIPMTFGVFRPTILLPEESRDWSSERRQVVLLHELAHILRGDTATHLLARAALALHWWNPLAWTAWRESLKERERAADDLVLAAGAAPAEYAGHLLEIARSLHTQPAGAIAAVAMARRSQLEWRLLAILDGRTARSRYRPASIVAAIALAVAIVAPLASIRAQSPTRQSAAPLPDVDTAIAAANAQKDRQILDEAAVSYETLRKFAEAQKLREASLSLAERQSGPQSGAYAAALVKLGDLARLRGARSDAITYYTRALTFGDRPEAFGALLHLGRDAFRGDGITTIAGFPSFVPDPARALDYLNRAAAVAPNGNDLGTALTWTVQVRQSQADGAAEAEGLYRRAIAVEDPGSAQQALSLELYAQFLRSQDRAADAAVADSQAKAIRKARLGAPVPRQVPLLSAVKMGPGVKAPMLIFKMEPAYTEEARAAKLAGTSILRVVVDTDGLAKDIEVVTPLGMGLDEQAVLAVRTWRFQPGEKDGVAVPVAAAIEVNFRLQ
jgi:TonB family protein